MSDEPRTAPAWARWITYGALVLASVALVWSILSVGVGELVTRLVRLGPWLVVVIAIEVLVTTCDAGAMHAFLGRARARAGGFGRTIFCQVAARAVNVITPLGSLGEAVRTALLVERVPPTRAFTTVLLYNVLGISLSFVLVGVGGVVTALTVDLPRGLNVSLGIIGAVLAVAATVLPVLLLRGSLARVLDLGKRLRLLGPERHRRWRSAVERVDVELRDEDGAERRDRRVGFACLLASRLLTWTGTAVLVYAAGGPLSLAFLAAVFTAGQLITWAATVVPLGVGVSEGGNYALFRALGVDPVIGVTVALGRRVTHIVYAGIGLSLVAANQTVQDLRRRYRGGHAAPVRPRPAER